MCKPPPPPPAPGASDPSGAAAQAGPRLRAEASPWGRGARFSTRLGGQEGPGPDSVPVGQREGWGRDWGVTTLFASHPGLLCGLGEAARLCRHPEV